MEPSEQPEAEPSQGPAKPERTGGILGIIERVGNLLPDPAILFALALGIVWGLSYWMSSKGIEFTMPVPNEDGTPNVQSIKNLLTGAAMADFLSRMVEIFTGFHPLGVVLVALLGIGVAEHSGFINAILKCLLALTPKLLLTPALILVAIVSHTAADAGYVLVIPLGGVIFYTAGRHPLAGIVAAFAGVSGGFSANFVPSGIDPLLQGFTAAGANVLDTSYEVNPLCNWFFMGASCALIIIIGWFITDRIVEPRLNAGSKVDGDSSNFPKMEKIKGSEIAGMLAGLLAFGACIWVLIEFMIMPIDSPFLDQTPDPDLTHFDRVTSFKAPLMQSIVPLLFLVFLVPGVVHGFVSGTYKRGADVIKGMSNAMSTMGYYLVMAFFAALFIDAFNQSNIGKYLAVEGGQWLKSMNMPSMITLVGIILLCGGVNLLVGSASAKWAMLAPIFVPMLMSVGIAPELTQAAYRVGDSSTNIITPLMPYFPLVVAFSQRWVKKCGIGTLISLMLPYSIAFLALWTALLLGFWGLHEAGITIPLGISGRYDYVVPK